MNDVSCRQVIDGFETGCVFLEEKIVTAVVHKGKLYLCKDQRSPDLEQTAATRRKIPAQNLEAFISE